MKKTWALWPAWVLGAALLLAAAGPAWAADKEVITLGANLDSAQQKEMLDLFGVDRDSVTVLEVTNAEERQYLEGAISDEQIGTRAISSVYVRIKDDGSGIAVQAKNITYVTEQTYANALVTAGIADADIYAAAPFPVSGTAALTGIFKAFEEATGQQIPEEAKQVATEELVDTAEVGDQVGDKSGVAELVKQAKEEMIRRGLTDEASIREVVIRIAAELNVNLTDEQIDQLVNILVKIQGLDLDIDKIQQQLRDFQTRIGLSDEEAKGIWESIKSVFQKIWDAIFG
ncbi:MAG: DUF1002 domain-containing protein [Thermoleophilia bacterium]|nr:DUF1002 domain-containing protein [Thermoleophilia bacterium]